MDKPICVTSNRLAERRLRIASESETPAKDGRVAVRLEQSELRSVVWGEIGQLADEVLAGLPAQKVRDRLDRIRDLAQAMTE